MAWRRCRRWTLEFSCRKIFPRSDILSRLGSSSVHFTFGIFYKFRSWTENTAKMPLLPLLVLHKMPLLHLEKIFAARKILQIGIELSLLLRNVMSVVNNRFYILQPLCWLVNQFPLYPQSRPLFASLRMEISGAHFIHTWGAHEGFSTPGLKIRGKFLHLRMEIPHPHLEIWFSTPEISAK